MAIHHTLRPGFFMTPSMSVALKTCRDSRVVKRLADRDGQETTWD